MNAINEIYSERIEKNVKMVQMSLQSGWCLHKMRRGVRGHTDRNIPGREKDSETGKAVFVVWTGQSGDFRRGSRREG